jgi:twitching motility protein PilT
LSQRIRGDVMKEQVEKLMRAAFDYHASDIHLTVGIPPVFRVNGELKKYGTEPLTSQQTELIAKSMMTGKLWLKFQEEGEIDFSYSLEELSRFRINAFFQRGAISLALRMIPSAIPSLEELFMPDILKNIAAKPQGLVLVTGPTGSGKSTTLAALLTHMNQTMRKHIITLEDPIEYIHKHAKSVIDQREIGFDTQSFAAGLRSALRQDPDVILVGEMRDLETISTAITAAETGHLVFGTLHTLDAPSTIDRIIDVFPPGQQAQIRFQLAAVLVAVVAQRLFPTVDRKGRRAATEILLNNSAVANLIRNGKVHQIPSVIQTSKAVGMQTLEMSIRDLLQGGIISREAAGAYLMERN